MSNLDFDIKLKENPQNPQSLQSQQIQQNPAQSEGILQDFLNKSSHPTAIIFHYIFKILGVVSYFFLGIFLRSSIIEFVVIILFAAFDFWTVQNITGRLLVGLKWRNQMKEDGSEEWIFESFNEEIVTNSADFYAFWVGAVSAPLVWGILLIANILTFSLSNSLLMGGCFLLSGINFYAFYLCRKDHKQKISSLVQQGVSQAAKNIV